LPFPLAKEFDAGAIHQQVELPVGTAIRYPHLEGLLPSHKVE
jgi:hypothetical protein